MKDINGSIAIPEDTSDKEVNELAEWLESLSFEDLQTIMRSHVMAKAEIHAQRIGASIYGH